MIKVTYQVERVLDWGLIVHWSEEVGLESHNNNLLEHLISHKELLAGS